MRATYHGVVMLAGADARSAEKAIADGRADIIAFGRPFIANPDLPWRLRTSAALNTPDPATFFGAHRSGLYRLSQGRSSAPGGNTGGTTGRRRVRSVAMSGWPRERCQKIEEGRNCAANRAGSADTARRSPSWPDPG